MNWRIGAAAQGGALFGLDARIALGVFALISLVAGAVTFSRIDTAREAVVLSELDAIHNALTNYQTDMGTFFLFTLNRPEGEDSSDMDITALWDINMVKEGFRKNWRGPYLHRTTRRFLKFGEMKLVYATHDRRSNCDVDSTCAVWLSVGNVPAATWDKINAWYDEAHGKAREYKGLDFSLGRVQADAETDPRVLYFRTLERVAPGEAP